MVTMIVRCKRRRGLVRITGASDMAYKWHVALAVAKVAAVGGLAMWLAL
jgi:hypothetical protein